MKKVFGFLFFAALSVAVIAQPKVGDKAPAFNLKNVNGKMVALSDYADQDGVIVIFTCNHCPFAKAYESRIIELQEQFGSKGGLKGFPVVAINPNDAKRSPADDFNSMVIQAKDKNYNFPYLHDESQEVAEAYGATRTPHVFLINNKDGGKIAYIGAIDDNAMNEADVEETYLENAINNLKAGKPVDPDFTKAVGCTIKWAKI